MTASSKDSGARQSGITKWYNQDKGYGFIVPDDGGPDVFVHANALHRAGISDGLDEGERVAFDTLPGKDGKGPKAVNVRKL